MLCTQCDRRRPANARVGGACGFKCGNFAASTAFKYCINCSKKKKVCQGCGVSLKTEKKGEDKKVVTKPKKDKKKDEQTVLPVQKLTAEQALVQVVGLREKAHHAGFRNDVVVSAELGMQANVAATEALVHAQELVAEKVGIAKFKFSSGSPLESLEALSQAAAMLATYSQIIQNAVMAQQVPDVKCQTK